MKSYIFFFLLGALVISACTQPAPVKASNSKKGMIKITIMYPAADSSSFDMDYYAEKHMPMVARLLGDSLKILEIDKGLSGRTPEEPSPYMAIGYLYFDQLSAYQNSFGPHAETILNDIPNYTNVQPVLQISEVVK